MVPIIEVHIKKIGAYAANFVLRTTNMDKETLTEDTYGDFIKVYIAVVVIFITLVLFLIYRSRRTSRRCILLTGLCNSGKTVLYARLVHGRSIETFTSMKENAGEYVINGSSLKIIDIPGHERVRDKFFDKYKVEAKAIVYVVDSTLIQEEICDIAEYLYNILSCPDIRNNNINILILCNKQDIPSSKNCDDVKSLLEKEM
ncbi:ADP ribosylation factor [Oryctes borbonicus]|uniref:Signal recognition particle receptor subunit beta n=1 Tax=Oryctes borbonicus TaxID=1629725 RepID=A0A0T6ASN7_9SCAR|nr:ADP ribosylation factor [Oryctes borbonicus]